MGSSSTYAQAMYNLFTNEEFRAGKIASNETFKRLDIPEYPERGIRNIIQVMFIAVITISIIIIIIIIIVITINTISISINIIITIMIGLLLLCIVLLLLLLLVLVLSAY